MLGFIGVLLIIPKYLARNYGAKVQISRSTRQPAATSNVSLMPHGGY